MSASLSPNFTLEEMLRSSVALRRWIYNVPDPQSVAYLRQLCSTLLEPIRLLLGVPLHVDSGYRCSALNIAICGAVDSAHLYGRAADIIPVGIELQDAFDLIKQHGELPIDQLIIECNAWLHVGMAPTGAKPRGEYLVGSGAPGHWSYTPA